MTAPVGRLTKKGTRGTNQIAQTNMAKKVTVKNETKLRLYLAKKGKEIQKSVQKKKP